MLGVDLQVELQISQYWNSNKTQILTERVDECKRGCKAKLEFG